MSKILSSIILLATFLTVICLMQGTTESLSVYLLKNVSAFLIGLYGGYVVGRLISKKNV